MKPVRIVLFVLALFLLAAGAYLVISGNGVFKQLAVMLETAPAEIDLSETMEDDGTIEDGDTFENTNQSSTQAANTTQKAVDLIPPADEEPREPEIRFMAIGDIMLGRGVGFRLKKAGDYRKAFEKVSFYLDMGDIVFANLETPLTASNHGLDKDRKIVLKAEPESVVALTSAGINLVSLANNHMMDYYEKGLMDTIELLNLNNIAHAGGGINIDEARKPAIIEKNGLKIGLLAYKDMAELVFAGDPYLSFAA